MEGLKFKVAHKRPHWLKWSTEYPDNVSDRDRTLSILEEVTEKLRYCAERDYRNLASSFP
jgi:outer membrane lipoprotein-sorting protein